MTDNKDKAYRDWKRGVLATRSWERSSCLISNLYAQLSSSITVLIFGTSAGMSFSVGDGLPKFHTSFTTKQLNNAFPSILRQ